jgi:hypothetical protein
MRNRSRTWTGKTWLALVAILWVVAAGLVLSGCGESPQPITITNININTNTNQGGGSGAKDPEAVPGSVTTDTHTVTINGMAGGENCPPGILKADQAGKFRVGCTLDITVNPRTADGKVIHDDKAPPPDYFLSLGPDSVATFTKDSNPYNARLKGLSPGSVKLIAGVNGKRSPETFFEVVP